MKRFFTLVTLLVLFGSVDAQISTFPYSQDFESFSTCTASCQSACALSGFWNNPSVGDFMDWTVDVNGTPSSGTGPSVDHTLGTSTGHYLYIESSTPCNGTNKTAHLESPWFDFTNISAPAIKFWYHMLGSSMGTMHVDVDTANGSAWILDVVPSWTGNSNDWIEQIVNLTALGAGRDSLRFRIRGVAGSSFTSDMAVDDFLVYNVPPIDINVAVVDSPAVSACGLGLENVVITLINEGSDTLTSGTVIPLCYSDSTVTVCDSLTLTSNFLPGDTLPFTFGTPINLSAPGDYYLFAYTTLSGDGNAINDTAYSGLIQSIPTISTLPYFEGFENGTGGWSSGGANSSWEWGTFAGASIGTPPSCGPNGWATNLTGSYNNNENSFLRSPCLDFSGLSSDPEIRFLHALNIETFFDATWLEVSTNGGATWTKLGVTGGQGSNWYNTNDNDWDGTAGWRTATHPLTGLAGVSNAAIRFVFSSDGSVTPEGTGIDDIYILASGTTIADGRAVNLLAPQSSCGLSASDTITGQFIVQGNDTVAGVPVCYILDNGTPVCDSIVGPFLPGDTIVYSFPTTGNFSSSGNHTVTLYTDLSNEFNTCNDSTTFTVVNIPLISTFPYLERFENGPGFWTLEGSNNSWTLGLPAKNTIQGAGSGSNSWVTGGLGTTLYSPNENGTVVSPCFDFSNAPAGQWVALKIWWNSEFSWDGSNLQYSTDNGATWTNIGAFGDPFNWYNDNSINGNPGGNQTGWTGRGVSGSGGYVFAKHELPTAISGASQVRFRMTFGSDGSVQDDGTAWDDFAIGIPTQIDLGPDTTVCGGYTLNTNMGMTGQVWEWSNGATTPSIQLLNTTSTPRVDTISLVYTDTLGFCTEDTVIITVNPAPFIDIADTTICSGTMTTLDASPSGATSYVWSTNDTTSSIMAGAGNYAVVISNPVVNGCTYTDSVSVTNFPVANAGAPVVDYCPGDTVMLDAGISSANYLWSTGDTTQMIMVTMDGTYSVTATDNNGCVSGDTVTTIAESPADLGVDLFLCDGITDTLDPGVMGGSWMWSTGDTTGTIVVSNAGSYTVQVTSALGCVSSDTVVVTTENSPVAAFSFITAGAGISYDFTDASTGGPATSWFWDFGDGNTDTIQNPSHTYATDGSYTVTLIVTNPCGSDTTTQSLIVLGTGNFLREGAVNIFPNPNNGSFSVSLSGINGQTMIEVYNLYGQRVYEVNPGQVTGDHTEALSLEQNSKGTYFVKVTVDGNSTFHKVVIQ